jgi:hypothetical protein
MYTVRIPLALNQIYHVSQYPKVILLSILYGASRNFRYFNQRNALSVLMPSALTFQSHSMNVLGIAHHVRLSRALR